MVMCHRMRRYIVRLFSFPFPTEAATGDSIINRRKLA